MEILPHLIRPATAEVMIVEDDQAVAASLSRGLAALGWLVHVVHNMSEALAQLAACPEITVVVTDIRMPNGSGLELAEAVKRTRPDELAAEVIIITGHGTTDDMAAAMRLRACDFLLKPFRLDEINEAVTKAAAQAQAHRDVIRAAKEMQTSATNLSEELAGLRAKLDEMCRAAEKSGDLSAAEREKAHEAISRTLRGPLGAISYGACLLGQESEGGINETQLEQLRAGVTGAVTAIELLEEFNRPQRDPYAAASRIDLAVLATAAAKAISTCSDISLQATGGLHGVSLPIYAPRVSLSRAVTLCFEAAVEWAPAGWQICYAFRTDGAPASQACLTISIIPSVEDAASRPEGMERSTSGSLESLRILLARRLLAGCAGHLACWEGSGGLGVISLTVPLASVA